MARTFTWARVVIPTLNSARWISPIVKAYQDVGATPLYLVDRQSTDDTFELITHLGGKAIGVDLSAPYVETLIPELRHLLGDGWIFRADDDEFPSAGVFTWLRGPEPDGDVDSFAIQRRWVRRSHEGRLQSADCRLWTDRTREVGSDRQWRVFHTERVKYVTAIHSPGFVPARWKNAPEDAFLIHFDWVIRSEAERAAKISRYDQLVANSGSRAWMYYLHERIPEGDVRWVLLDTNEFDQLAEALSHKGENRSR